ncbi:MAG: prepilin-type N-terminal cleavage/methylation domain-containing protein [Gammaproteobacteria bacterium]|nr:prepilin-type N-terminal cleavage/methylation domain-containing protein [Gammaproteobacteria bacterium]
MNRQLNAQKGFTLIEIAIVLVIIGLLLGGVLKGQELINTARVRALNNSVDGITAAWFSFQDRYRAFPGDYRQATINLPDPNTILVNGDGNGLVATDVERGQIWAHLESAGYITGGFNGDAIAAADEYACQVGNCPDNGFGSGMLVNHGLLQVGTAAQANPTNAHELNTGRGIPVDVLAELDRKVDDGVPTTGLMQVGINGTGWTNSAACINTTPTPDAYQVLNPTDDCAAVFRNF